MPQPHPPMGSSYRGLCLGPGCDGMGTEAYLKEDGRWAECEHTHLLLCSGYFFIVPRAFAGVATHGPPFG